MRQGHGEQVFANGSWYVGMWVEDYKHGWGTHTGKLGSVYEGEWVRGKKQGQGTRKGVNGSTYSGNWVNGRMDGKGVFQYPQAKYEGERKYGKKHGYGVFTSDSGEIFKGTFHNGRPLNGFGTYNIERSEPKEGVESEVLSKWSIGTFTGEWKDSKPTGEGVLVYYNGMTQKGTWDGDSFRGTVTTKQGGVNAGEWYQGLPDGHGIYKYTDGSVYEGGIVNAKRHGQGVITYPTGECFKGVFMNGKPYEGAGAYLIQFPHLNNNSDIINSK